MRMGFLNRIASRFFPYYLIVATSTDISLLCVAKSYNDLEADAVVRRV